MFQFCFTLKLGHFIVSTLFSYVTQRASLTEKIKIIRNDLLFYPVTENKTFGQTFIKVNYIIKAN
jgi:hypothetical protein